MPALNWLIQTTPAPDRQNLAVAWSPELSLFAAVSGDGSGEQIMTSPDGLVWTKRTTPTVSGLTNVYNSIAWSPALGLFVASRGSSSLTSPTCIMTSSDGISWTLRSLSHQSSHISHQLVWAPALGKFVLLGKQSGSLTYHDQSTDGIIWTDTTIANDGFREWLGMAWAPSLSLFAAVCTEGTGNKALTSPNGTTWTPRATPATDRAWQAIAWSPELTLFAAVANNGTGQRVMTSPDGLNWTLRTSPTDRAWTAIEWGPPPVSRFVAVASSGHVMESADGVTWIDGTVPASLNDWRHVAWSTSLGRFVAVASSGSANRVMVSDPAMFEGGPRAILGPRWRARRRGRMQPKVFGRLGLTISTRMPRVRVTAAQDTISVEAFAQTSILIKVTDETTRSR